MEMGAPNSPIDFVDKKNDDTVLNYRLVFAFYCFGVFYSYHFQGFVLLSHVFTIGDGKNITLLQLWDTIFYCSSVSGSSIVPLGKS